MHRARELALTAAPWAAIAAVVLALLLKFSAKSPTECVIIAALAVAMGLLCDHLATQFRTHMLGFWDRGT
jgi:hypothetical protein